MLANRLLGRAHLHAVGPNTDAAETALGLPRSFYWSVGTSNSIYVGPTGTMWEPEPGVGVPGLGGQLTPFDTGGLHHGFISTHPPLDPADHRSYVEKNTFKVAGWETRLTDSIANCWAGNAVAYVEGQKPTVRLTTRSHDVPGNLAPAWLWEARLPMSSGVEAEVRVTHLFWHPASAVTFEAFLNSSGVLTVAEAEALSALLVAIAVETPSPVLEMQSQLNLETPMRC